MPLTDEMLTIDPPRPRGMDGTTAFMPSKMPTG